MMYSPWPLFFSILCVVSILIVFVIGTAHVTNLGDALLFKNIFVICTTILTVIVLINNLGGAVNFISPFKTQYLVQASCSMSNENYTIFKTENSEYKIEGNYPYGKDYILLMEDDNGLYKDDKVLNIYSSDINLLMQEKEEE